jgi:DNA invertase Pin-like site-specific DNA recombinase
MTSNDPTPIPAVVYAAKSTADTGGSIPDQLRRAHAAAETEQRIVLSEHRDEGFSAYSGNRGPGLAAAIAAATAAAPSELWVLHSDRLARGAGDEPGAADSLVEIWHRLRRRSVVIRSVEDDDDLQDPVLVAVLAKRNWLDSRRKSKAVKAGVRRRGERGQAHGGPPPYGYRWAGNNGGLQVEPGEAAIVERIYREYLSGVRQQAIAKRLNGERVPTRNGWANWHQATIKGILERPTYRGAVQLKIRDDPDDRRKVTETREVEGQHPPIISPALWHEVTALRAAQSRAPGKGRGRPADGFLLSRGLLVCSCGAAMVPRTNHNRRQDPYEVYRCYGRQRGGDPCDMPPLPRRLVDATVTDYFIGAVLDVEETRQRAAAAADHALREATGLREQADREASRARERLARVRRDYQDGELPVADWNEQREQLEAELAAADAEAERLGDRERAVHDLPELPEALEDLHRRLLAPVTEADTTASLRAGLQRVFERFEVLRVPLHGASDAELRGDLPMREDAAVDPQDAPDALLPRLKVQADGRVLADRAWREEPAEGEPLDLTRDPFVPGRPPTAAERRELARRDRERPAEVLALIPIPRSEVVLGSGAAGRLPILPAALDQAPGDRDDESGNGLVT